MLKTILGCFALPFLKKGILMRRIHLVESTTQVKSLHLIRILFNYKFYVD